MAEPEYNYFFRGTHYELTINDPDNTIVDLVLPSDHNDYPVISATYTPDVQNAASLETIKVPNTYVSLTVRGQLDNFKAIYFDGIDCVANLTLYPAINVPHKLFIELEPSDENIIYDIVYPEAKTEYLSNVFMYVTNIGSFTGKGITHFRSSQAFAHCDNLKKIVLPNVEDLADGCFHNCQNLEEVILCDKENVQSSQNRLSGINLNYLYSFEYESEEKETRLVLPASTKNLFSDNYAIYSKILVLSGKDTGEEFTYITPNDEIDLEIYHYAESYQTAENGEWFFTSDDSTAIKGEDEVQEYTFSFEISCKTPPQSTLGAQFGNIGRYQTNKYYYAGSFDFMIRGSISSEDSQPIKGNIIHLRSMEIKYFDDNIHIDHDDLVVVDGRLYGVEGITYDIKRSPKPYVVYFATLNNIK